MFQIHPSLLTYWNNNPSALATAEDIAIIETTLNLKLPQDYIDFISTYGFVVFGRDEDATEIFKCSVTLPDRIKYEEADIAFLHGPSNDIITTYNNLTNPDFGGYEYCPSFPNTYLPIGNDAGQGQILMELSPNKGQIWYWREVEYKWGEPENDKLYFVSPNFTDFINNLQTSMKETDAESVLNDLIRNYIENGCHISDTIYYANLINTKYVLYDEDIERINKLFLTHENPQVRRLGLHTLKNHAPKNAHLLKPLFFDFLKDNSVWCIYDAINGLEKMAMYLNEANIEQLKYIKDNHSHAQTKEAAQKLLKQIDVFKHPELKTIENKKIGLELCLPKEWIEIEDPFKQVIPLSYQDVENKNIHFKCAVMKLPENIKEIEEVVLLNKKQYVNIWEIHREWKLDHLNGIAVLLTQSLIGNSSNEAKSNVLKCFLMNEKNVFYLSYSYPYGTEEIYENLMNTLSQTIKWI